MNKKGFSYIEFVAIVGILVVIAFIAIPIFSKLFINSKKSGFEIEARDFFRQSQNSNYGLDSSINDTVYEYGSGDCKEKIDYSKNINLRYYLKLKRGEVIEYRITDGKYALEYKIEDHKNINNIEAVMLVGRQSPYTFLYGTCAADIKDAKPFEVTFDANGGTGGQVNPVSATYQEDMPAILTNKPTKNGYTFMGWYTDSDYTKGVQFYNSNCTSSKKYDLTKDTVLYAGWIKDEDDKKLYTVLEKESSNGTYAKEYTSNHKDSFTALGEYKIHYYYSINSIGSSVINNNKRNVIFAGKCFQILRTTDNGGIKLIYNGEVSSNKTCDNKRTHNGIVAKSKEKLNSGSYAVSDTFEYDLSNNKFKLSGDISVNNVTNTNMKDGKYSCLDSNKSSTCSTIYYIVSYDNELYKYPYIISSTNYSQIGTTAFNYANTSVGGGGYMTNELYPSKTKVFYISGNSVDDSITYMYLSKSITKNSDGTYSLDSNSLVSTSGTDWKKNYNSYKGYYFCNGFKDKSCSEEDMFYLITPTISGNQYYYKKFDKNINYLFTSNYSYINGKYILNNDKNSLLVKDWPNNYNNLGSNRYTCLNNSGECSKLYYVYHADISSMNYIIVSSNKSAKDMVDEMLTSDKVNKNDSMIKKYIDNWYYNNLKKYSDYLEDYVYCSDRYINSYGEFNLDTKTNKISIGSNKGLSCINKTDMFSKENNAAKLEYPISLMTGEEAKILNDNNLRKTGYSYWIDDNYNYDSTVNRNAINETGGFTNANISNIYGVRPVITLKKDTKYISGDGSVEKPYIITSE